MVYIILMYDSKVYDFFFFYTLSGPGGYYSRIQCVIRRLYGAARDRPPSTTGKTRSKSLRKSKKIHNYAFIARTDNIYYNNVFGIQCIMRNNNIVLLILCTIYTFYIYPRRTRDS